MGIRLHPRYQIVQEARHEVGKALTDAIDKHGLTYGEIFSVLSDVMGEWAKYAIRSERHPDDASKKGDEA